MHCLYVREKLYQDSIDLMCQVVNQKCSVNVLELSAHNEIATSGCHETAPV